MKIGIITYWDSKDNYGQLLQCYALQKYLRMIGHNPYLIRYKPQNKSDFTLSKLKPQNILNYVRYRLSQYDTGKNEEVKRDFDTFRNRLSVSEKIYNGSQDLMTEIWNDTDIFICGSDQIWSPKSYEELVAYYLKFTPFQKKRIAYAPSFGRQELDPVYSKILPDLIKDFDAISVREVSGVNIIRQAGAIAELVCDPTILLEGKIYREEFLLHSTTKKNSCFCYFINWETDLVEDELIAFCNLHNLEASLFCTNGYNSKIKKNKEQSPESWLQTLAQSKFSAVNSFHGLVFSILFHVPFAVYLLKGQQAGMNSRIHSLLEFLDLSNRIVTKDNTIENIHSTDIDWDSVDKKIEDFRNISAKFLNEAICSRKKLDSETSKNICFLTHGSVHHFYGGLDRVTELLADRFIYDGHNVYYLSVVNRGKFDKTRQYFLPDSKNRQSVENSQYLTQFLKEKKIDILVNQEGNVNLCIPFDGRESVKVITCLHFNPNYIDDNHFKNKFSKSYFPINLIARGLLSIKLVNNLLLRYLRKKLANNYHINLNWCDKFILLSPLFKKSLKELVRNDSNMYKVEAIHNPNNICPQQYPNKEKIILYVGRLDNNFKRVDTLIDDVSSVLKEHPDWRMVICGEGPDKEFLQNKAKNMDANIEFTGYCDPLDYYKKASIIVLRSSKSEGWGMVLVEAMSHGVVPVVAGTYDSLPDIIDDNINGVITRDNHSEFSSALRDLIYDEEKLKTMGLKAVNKASAFDISIIANEWYKLFSL